MKYEKIKNYGDRKFKRLTGVSRVLFEIMAEVIEFALALKHKRGGRPPKLSSENMLLLFLCYYRNYDTFLVMGEQFDLHESNAYRRINWCESVLSVAFGSLINDLISMKNINKEHEQIVDVTECNIQRPIDNDIQREYYSEKKKKHTIKIQIIMDEKTKEIVGVAFDKGSVHDFNLFKNTTSELSAYLSFLADSGYQGIPKLFEKSLTPKKKLKNNPLADQDKELNKLISNIEIQLNI